MPEYLRQLELELQIRLEVLAEFNGAPIGDVLEEHDAGFGEKATSALALAYVEAEASRRFADRWRDLKHGRIS